MGACERVHRQRPRAGRGRYRGSLSDGLTPLTEPADALCAVYFCHRPLSLGSNDEELAELLTSLDVVNGDGPVSPAELTFELALRGSRRLSSCSASRIMPPLVQGT